MNWSSLFAARNAAALFALAVPALLAQAPPVNFQSTEIHPRPYHHLPLQRPRREEDHPRHPRPHQAHPDGEGNRRHLDRDHSAAATRYLQLLLRRRGPVAGSTRPTPTSLSSTRTSPTCSPCPATAPNSGTRRTCLMARSHHHYYDSKVVLNLPANQSEFFVYTPPNYDPKAKTPYPVLYLLHGFNEAPSSWTAVVKQITYSTTSLPRVR